LILTYFKQQHYINVWEIIRADIALDNSVYLSCQHNGMAALRSWRSYASGWL